MWSSSKKSTSSHEIAAMSSNATPPSQPTTSGTTSSAFSRLNRPGSGRLSSGSTPPSSLSPSSPATGAPGAAGGGGGGLVPEHRIRPLPPGSLAGLPAPGGGFIDGGGLMSPEQETKRAGLKISFSQPNMKRSQSQGFAPLTLPAFQQAVNIGKAAEEKSKLLLHKGKHSTGKLKLEEGEFDFQADDLVDHGEIGRGAFGTVNKMGFSAKGVTKIMAVKRIRSTVDEREQKELLMDLDVVMRSNDCPYIVLFFGAIFKEGDCWICMQLMSTSTDKFYKFIYDNLKESIPEKVIGKITVATVKALNYLKEKLKIIHRDVKPSNILLDGDGNIKLCDFGISGQLVDSIAKTRDAGCRPYMAPEKIDPQRNKGYDVRSDIWSLGITLIELATGCFPYPKWNSVFEQLQQVVHGDPPRLDPSTNGKFFTIEFVNFVNTCLIKDETQRPKYTRLLGHDFIVRSDSERVDVADYVTHILERYDAREGMDDEDAAAAEQPMDCMTTGS